MGSGREEWEGVRERRKVSVGEFVGVRVRVSVCVCEGEGERYGYIDRIRDREIERKG